MMGDGRMSDSDTPPWPPAYTLKATHLNAYIAPNAGTYYIYNQTMYMHAHSLDHRHDARTPKLSGTNSETNTNRISQHYENALITAQVNMCCHSFVNARPMAANKEFPWDRA